MKPTERSQLRQIPELGSHDPELIHKVLDALLIAHADFIVNAQPYVIAMLYARASSESLFLHGAAVSRVLRELATDIPESVAVTLVDGLVLARSAFHHSMNYRSVVPVGAGRNVAEPARTAKALRSICEHLIAGRWNDVPGPSRTKLETTSVVEFSIEEASVRRGPPIDDEDDYDRRVWARVLPLRLNALSACAGLPKLTGGCGSASLS
jgi:uncharacterized protein